MPVTQCAALITEPGRVELRTCDHTEPGPGQVVVQIHLCGVCIAEVKSFRDGTGHGPSLCGHEWVGHVVDVGDEVTSVIPGDRVVVAVPSPCGRCAPCRMGRTQSCSWVMSVARGRDENAPPHGGFARFLTVADYRVAKVPAELSDEDAALVEPAAVAFHGVGRAELQPGASVVVLGAGPIGLLTLQVAKALGARTTVVVEPLQQRRDAALAVGADAAVATLEQGREILNELTAGSGADVVFECAGTTDAVQHAVEIIAPGGRIVVLGDPVTATVQPRLWLAKEVTVVAAAGYSRDDIEAVMGLLAAKEVRIAPIHSRTIPLGAISGCLQAFTDGTTRDIKVLVDPRLPFTEEESQ